jgi:hypothetical protein
MADIQEKQLSMQNIAHRVNIIKIVLLLSVGQTSINLGIINHHYKGKQR